MRSKRLDLCKKSNMNNHGKQRLTEVLFIEAEFKSPHSTNYSLTDQKTDSDEGHGKPVSPMATQLRKGIAIASSSSSRMFVSKQMHDEIRIISPILSGFRWASSESGESAARKPNKKTSDRLSGVIDAVNDRKLPPELRGQRNNIRSETDIINVVEQRIWHSMEEGHFENLPGKGKPLNLNTNPHADPAEDTLYRILSRNNCAPEWVELNKGIRSDVAQWRLILKKAWAHKENGDMTKWMNIQNL
ncbi:hypothetical protein E3N88_00426 [Mikania micrantha]|uniref:DnaJ homologue subfamily C member 28 conserved domain-containing protein n=1 Tax=Mikania micrantha TaxID=192012 RepID=A0A5N6Q0R3_9ASTR|nr:hypothetical protein E3N88_00426 [Mikania micrantha]